jgi:hypothetical protein
VAFSLQRGLLACISHPKRHQDEADREPFIVATFVFFTLFPVSLLFARSFAWLVVAFVIRGLKEFGETARKSFSLRRSRREGGCIVSHTRCRHRVEAAFNPSHRVKRESGSRFN